MDAHAIVTADPARILLIRRDNIGDLVCTTPLIRALRERFPSAHLAAYVNSYNRAVLDGNPDLDAVHVYTKGKHLATGSNPVAHYWGRVRQVWALRGAAFDDVIIAEPAYAPRLVRLARFLGAGRIVGFGDAQGDGPGLDVCVPRGSAAEVARLHEVEDVFRLARVYGIERPPGPVRIFATEYAPPLGGKPVWGVHISARKPSQRWPVGHFAELLRALHAQTGANIRLFWAPGAADDPRHPGDDDKARALMAALEGLPVEACATHELRALIDGLAGCSALLCSDGGAMHLAAGLGKPIACLFGKSDAVRWRPWGVPYELLQKPSLEVADVGVDEVLAACLRLPVGKS